jgi:glycosyltransferase involved in cell wall biosynthesis
MTEGVRAAILTPYTWPHYAGGVEVFNEYIRRVFGTVEIFADDIAGGKTRFGDLSRLGLAQPAGALRAARVLGRRHEEKPFDIILSNGVYGWPPSLAKLGVPLIQVYHATMAGFAEHALSRRSDRLATGQVMALFDRLAGIGKHVVAISRRLQREVESYYGFKARLIYNAVDTNTFRPMHRASARKALGLPQGIPIGLFVGRPDPTKGYDVLLRVAQRMPRILFAVAGGGGGRSGNVWSMGQIAHENMPLLYSASDFFFLPSRYEGFGLALLEALACDIPAVVSEPAWPFSEDPSPCGTVVRSDSERDFVEAIQLVLDGRPRLTPREFILPRFSFESFQDNWRSFIESVLDAGGCPPDFT